MGGGGRMCSSFVIVPWPFAFSSFNMCRKLSRKHESKIDLLGVVFKSLPRLGVG